MDSTPNGKAVESNPRDGVIPMNKVKIAVVIVTIITILVLTSKVAA